MHDQLEQRVAKTDVKVERLEQEVKRQRTWDEKKTFPWLFFRRCGTTLLCINLSVLSNVNNTFFSWTFSLTRSFATLQPYVVEVGTFHSRPSVWETFRTQFYWSFISVKTVKFKYAHQNKWIFFLLLTNPRNFLVNLLKLSFMWNDLKDTNWCLFCVSFFL